MNVYYERDKEKRISKYISDDFETFSGNSDEKAFKEETSNEKDNS